MNTMMIYGGMKMALITKNKMDLHEKAMLENAEADNAKNAANIDYIAMMADIEIPTEEEDGNGTQC